MGPAKWPQHLPSLPERGDPTGDCLHLASKRSPLRALPRGGGAGHAHLRSCSSSRESLEETAFMLLVEETDFVPPPPGRVLGQDVMPLDTLLCNQETSDISTIFLALSPHPVTLVKMEAPVKLPNLLMLLLFSLGVRLHEDTFPV